MLFRPYLNVIAPLQPRRVSSVLGRHGRYSHLLICYLEIYQDARARGDPHQHLEQYRQDLKKYPVVPALLLLWELLKWVSTAYYLGVNLDTYVT